METGVYVIENRLTKKRYIGGTRESFDIRWKNHIYALANHKHYAKELQADYDSHGLDNFKFLVLEEVETGRVYEREKHWIKQAQVDGIVLYNAQTLEESELIRLRLDRSDQHNIKIIADRMGLEIGVRGTQTKVISQALSAVAVRLVAIWEAENLTPKNT